MTAVMDGVPIADAVPELQTATQGGTPASRTRLHWPLPEAQLWYRSTAWRQRGASSLCRSSRMSRMRSVKPGRMSSPLSDSSGPTIIPVLPR